MAAISLSTDYYQQFDANPSIPVPAEGYGGWRRGVVEVSREHTALVVMHAWDCGLPGEYPGWERAVEYQPRARQILQDVFPPLLAAARAGGMPVMHVVGGRDYYSHLPGYQGRNAAAVDHVLHRAVPDRVSIELEAFRSKNVFTGDHNRRDVEAGFARMDFAPQAHPAGSECIAENGVQLADACIQRGINHLIYIGFAINWCLLMSPGGMVDMRRYGFICSTVQEAVTAVENRETARDELEKRQALWRVSLEFGFVFHTDNLVAALQRSPRPKGSAPNVCGFTTNIRG